MANRRIEGWASGLMAACCIFAAPGCGSSVPELVPPEEPPEFVYRLTYGDTLSLRFPYYPNFDVPLMRIPPDGKISVPLVGFLEAAGLTPEELQRELQERYSHELDRPDVTVSLVQGTGQQIFVGGHVNKSGHQSYHSGLTLYTAMLRAGGQRRSAKLSSVVLIRGAPTEKKEAYQVDITKVIKGEMEDIYLEPYDVVIFPAKIIDTAIKFKSLYVDGLWPRNVGVGFGFSYPLKGITSEVNFNVPGSVPIPSGAQ
jgi:polysaccharide export outer membrane protein